jgi:hypothetical protein
MRSGLRLLVLALALAACGRNLDAQMWECQLAVQKGNAGRDAAAARERARDIEACMEERGFRLDSSDSACRAGSVVSSCYRAK